MKTDILLVILGCIIGFLVAQILMKPEKITQTKVDYVYITKRDTVYYPKYYTVSKKDTVIVKDSVYIYEKTNYVAALDTVFEDSVLTAKVEFVSPIVLHPDSYFTFDYKTKISNTTILEKSSPSVFVYFGVGNTYDFINKKYGAGVSLGVGIKLLELY